MFLPPRRPDRQTDMQIVHGIVILLLIWRRALISSHPWPNLLFISSVENCLSLTCQSPFADCIHYTHHDIWFPHWQQNYMCTNILYFYILYIFSRFTVHAVLINVMQVKFHYFLSRKITSEAVCFDNYSKMYLGFPCHSKNVRLNYEEQIVMQSIYVSQTHRIKLLTTCATQATADRFWTEHRLHAGPAHEVD